MEVEGWGGGSASDCYRRKCTSELDTEELQWPESKESTGSERPEPQTFGETQFGCVALPGQSIDVVVLFELLVVAAQC